MMNVEAGWVTLGAVDEVKFDKFVQKTIASNLRAKAKGHRDYKDMSVEELTTGAHSYCNLYRHQFKTQTFNPS